jgi:hypothetical protein
MSKRYSVSEVRERFADALDEADRGAPVTIERRGVRYQLTRVTAEPGKRAVGRRPRIKVLDPAVAAGQWAWEWSPGGPPVFADTRKKRR